MTSYHPDILTLELQALNRLSPRESAELDDHLSRCDHCLELASDVHQETRALLRDLVVDAYVMQQQMPNTIRPSKRAFNRAWSASS